MPRLRRRWPRQRRAFRFIVPAGRRGRGPGCADPAGRPRRDNPHSPPEARAEASPGPSLQRPSAHAAPEPRRERGVHAAGGGRSERTAGRRGAARQLPVRLCEARGARGRRRPPGPSLPPVPAPPASPERPPRAPAPPGPAASPGARPRPAPRAPEAPSPGSGTRRPAGTVGVRSVPGGRHLASCGASGRPGAARGAEEGLGLGREPWLRPVPLPPRLAELRAGRGGEVAPGLRLPALPRPSSGEGTPFLRAAGGARRLRMFLPTPSAPRAGSRCVRRPGSRLWRPLLADSGSPAGPGCPHARGTWVGRAGGPGPRAARRARATPGGRGAHSSARPAARGRRNGDAEPVLGRRPGERGAVGLGSQLKTPRLRDARALSQSPQPAASNRLPASSPPPGRLAPGIPSSKRALGP